MIKNIYKNLSKRAVLKFEYNNIGNIKKEIYFTNNDIAINFLLQDRDVKKLFVPEETENTIVGFDVKEKRFVKLFLSLIHTADLPNLQEFNPAAIEKSETIPEDIQVEILNAQKDILEGNVFKVSTSKIFIDPPKTNYFTNLKTALDIIGISDLQLNSKNPKIVGKCKKIWLDKILEHKNKIIQYLKTDLNSSPDIKNILDEIEKYDFKHALYNLQTPLDIVSYWPEILNPKPDFIVGVNNNLVDKEIKETYLSRILDSIDNDFKFYRYKIYGLNKGEFVQSEKAISINKKEDVIQYVSFPLDKNTLTSGEFGISNIYFVNNITLTKFDNNTFIFDINNLGRKKYDWNLELISDNEFVVKSQVDNFEFKAIKVEEITNIKEVVRNTIVFES